MPNHRAIKEWQEKLEALQIELATATDAEVKFKLEKSIQGAREKMAELSAEPTPSVRLGHRSSAEKVQISSGSTLSLVGLLGLIAEITGHLEKIAGHLPLLKSVPPGFIWAGLGILFLGGVLLLFRGLSRKSRLLRPDVLRLDP